MSPLTLTEYFPQDALQAPHPDPRPWFEVIALNPSTLIHHATPLLKKNNRDGGKKTLM